MALPQEQIERVREISRLASYAQAETLCGALLAVQETATVGDLAEWVALRSKFTDVDYKVKISAAKSRLVIRNRVRERLGLEPLSLASETSGVIYSANAATESVGIEYGW